MTYVRNNPVKVLDPLGLQPAEPPPLLVVDDFGPPPQTREHILLARSIEVSRLIVFVKPRPNILEPPSVVPAPDETSIPTGAVDCIISFSRCLNCSTVRWSNKMPFPCEPASVEPSPDEPPSSHEALRSLPTLANLWRPLVITIGLWEITPDFYEGLNELRKSWWENLLQGIITPPPIVIVIG